MQAASSPSSGAAVSASAVSGLLAGRPADHQRVTEGGDAAARQTGAVRITVWVRPGSARPGVGGERDGALVVRVGARAVDGQATEAALAAVAAAFGLRRRAVTLVAGATSRTKILEVEGADPAALSRLLADVAADGQRTCYWSRPRVKVGLGVVLGSSCSSLRSR